MQNNDAMLMLAKEFAAKAINESQERCGVTDPIKVTAEDMYVVWFCKTLQNWKALVSTDKIHPDGACGDYVEITHNGDKNETYCDVYKKTLNICYPDLLG